MSELGELLDQTDRQTEEEFPLAKPGAELVNLVFTIRSVERVAYKWEDKDREGFVTEVLVDGAAEPESYFLGGRYVIAEIKALKERGLLPIRLKLTRDSELKGNPYKLVAPDGGHAGLQTEPSLKESNNSRLAGYMVEHQMLAGDVLKILGWKLLENETVKDCWQRHIADLTAEGLRDKDGAHGFILANLMQRMAEEAGPPAEEETIPFE